MATREEQEMGQHGSGALVHESDRLAARPRVVLLAALAVFVVIGVVVAVSRGSTSSSPASGSAAAPAAGQGRIPPIGLSQLQLAGLVKRTIAHPVFWAGPRKGVTYELQRSSNGSIFIRYLPRGVRVGDPRAAFLLIATYPYPEALARLQGVANGAGAAVRGGGIALPVPGRPTNYHLAYPGMPFEAEVYDPSATVARQVALSGDIRTVG